MGFYGLFKKVEALKGGKIRRGARRGLLSSFPERSSLRCRFDIGIRPKCQFTVSEESMLISHSRPTSLRSFTWTESSSLFKTWVSSLFTPATLFFNCFAHETLSFPLSVLLFFFFFAFPNLYRFLVDSFRVPRSVD